MVFVLIPLVKAWQKTTQNLSKGFLMTTMIFISNGKGRAIRQERMQVRVQSEADTGSAEMRKNGIEHFEEKRYKLA